VTEQSKAPRTDAAIIIESLKNRINDSAKLQSLLYDIDLLPEQLQDDDLRRWGYVEAVVLHFEATETENADLRRQVEEHHAVLLQIHEILQHQSNRHVFKVNDNDQLTVKYLKGLCHAYEQAEAKLAAAQAEIEALREDAERYEMLFLDTWFGGDGIAIFRYIRSHEDFDRLGIEEANAHLDRVRIKHKAALDARKEQT
jgi:hypothetical protein